VSRYGIDVFKDVVFSMTRRMYGNAEIGLKTVGGSLGGETSNEKTPYLSRG
jgi:hypothetical protein